MNITKKRIVYTLAVALIVVFSTTFAVLMTLERMDYRNYLLSEYNKNMYQLINSVENIGSNLAKVPVLGSDQQHIIAFEEIFRYAAIANDKLHSLPIDEEKISGTSKFLTQVGDFCYVLSSSAAQGKQLSDDDIAKVELLKNEAYNLENGLKDVQNNINNGEVKWGEIRKKVSGVFLGSSSNAMAGKFDNIQKQITQYPSLVYDGPFSDNTLQIQPKINSAEQVSIKQAEQVVKNIIGSERIEEVKNGENVNSQKIPCYSFNIKMKNRNGKQDVVCEVTQKGGSLYYLLDNREVQKANIDPKKAEEIGTKYLDSIGYKNMTSTYSLIYNNVAIISYIFNINDVAVYSDQIKLKVALDDGSIIGIESAKYLTAHDDKRVVPDVKITQDQAEEKISKRINIATTRLAIVPTETNKEVLCYEFSGNYKADNFIVYINAETGNEVKILQIRNTPNGKLTI